MNPSGTVFEKILLDVEKDIYVENWVVSSEEFKDNSMSKWRIEKRRLKGGLGDGVDIVEVDNGRLSFTMVPTRGMGIWRGRCGEDSLGWDSPVKELVHPHYVNLEARNGLGWLAGFNEWVVRCGLENNGAPGEDVVVDNRGNQKRVILPLHGKVANIPASFVSAFVKAGKPMELGVNGEVYERSMFGPNLKLSTSVTTEVGSNWLRIRDVVENLGGIDTEMQLLYHCNYGTPLLEEGSHLMAPVKQVAPRDLRSSEGIESYSKFSKPQPGYVEQVYFHELLGDERGCTKVALVNKKATKATSLSFNLRQLPYFTLWKNMASVEDGYVIGLEPATNFPNHKAFERRHGRVVNLKPSERYEVEITFAVHSDEAEVRLLEDEVRKIQRRVKPKIFSHPDLEFSPG